MLSCLIEVEVQGSEGIGHPFGEVINTDLLLWRDEGQESKEGTVEITNVRGNERSRPRFP